MQADETGAAVRAALDGTVHSLQDNDAPLDYGPTVLLRHETDAGEEFFTLYGHLSRASLDGLVVGQRLRRGETLAAVEERAGELLVQIEGLADARIEAELEVTRAPVGGGSLPGFELPSRAVTLRGALGARHVGQPRAVGGPARRGVVAVAAGQRAVPAAVGAHDPQVGPEDVLHAVGEAAHVDDLRPVGRDARRRHRPVLRQAPRHRPRNDRQRIRQFVTANAQRHYALRRGL